MSIAYQPQHNQHFLDKFVTSHNSSTIYHTSNWLRVLEQSYRLKIAAIVIAENKNIKGFIPFAVRRGLRGKKRLSCLPYSHFVPPLFDSGNTFKRLIISAQCATERIHADYLQIKADCGPCSVNWSKTSPYYRSVLALNETPEDIFKKIKPGTRRNVKKALKSGLKIKVGDRLDDFYTFYELMVETRKRQGSPPYSRGFFLSIYKQLNASQRKLYLAYEGPRAIAGLLMLYHRQDALYAYGASVSDRKALRARPNDLLFWRAIRDSCQAGFKNFDFGLTPLENRGLLRYKSQWKARTSLVVYSYYSKSRKPIAYIDRSGPAVRLATALLKKMPKTFLKVTGPLLLRLVG